MNTFQHLNRNIFLTSKFSAVTSLLLLGTTSSAAKAQGKAYEYKPQFEKVAYSRTVPASIRSIAKGKGMTRFYGSFKTGEQTYAIHLYDTGSIKKNNRDFFKRNCCLEVFEQSANKTWQQIHMLPFSREFEARRDRLTVQVEKLWLDPTTKMVPMIYLKIMERDVRDEYPIGNQIYLYGVLQSSPKRVVFKRLDGNIPYSNNTVITSSISFPDAKGRLTILELESDPGENRYRIYGWNGKDWDNIASHNWQTGYEPAIVWNGTEFVPLTNPSCYLFDCLEGKSE